MRIMSNISKNTLLTNTIMLYIYTLAKILFPFILLPYLTRTLSVGMYGMVSFVRSYVIYIQLFVDFGFILSSVKDIVEAKGDKEIIGIITGHTIVAKVLLSLLSFIVTIIVIGQVSILENHVIYVFVSIFVVFVSSFLLDFLFRGLEQMQHFTIAFVIMKTISTGLTILLVKDDSDVLLIPILEVISSLIAVIYTSRVVVNLRIKIKIISIRKCFKMLKNSFVYFASNMATTAFGAFNTMIIGISLNDYNVAIWSVALNIVGAINAMYTPIVNGIYPSMIRSKSIATIRKVLVIFMPIIIIGCFLLFVFADFFVSIIAGNQYEYSSVILRYLIPVLLFSFPGMILGWPTLGVIGKNREVTITTVCTALIQVVGLIILHYTTGLTLVIVALFRSGTELFMLLFRGSYVTIYRREFTDCRANVRRE